VTMEYLPRCIRYAQHIRQESLANSEHQPSHRHYRCIQCVPVKVLRSRNLNDITISARLHQTTIAQHFNMHSCTKDNILTRDLLISPRHQRQDELQYARSFLSLQRLTNRLPSEPVSPLVSTTKSAGKPTAPPSRPGPKARIRDSL
jgi:hypothetical protein